MPKKTIIPFPSLQYFEVFNAPDFYKIALPLG